MRTGPMLGIGVIAVTLYFLFIFHTGGMMKYCLPTLIPVALGWGFVQIMSMWALRIGKKVADEEY